MAAKKKTKKTATKKPTKKPTKKAGKKKAAGKKGADKVLAGRLRQMKASGKLKKGKDHWTVDNAEICPKCGGRGFIEKK